MHLLAPLKCIFNSLLTDSIIDSASENNDQKKSGRRFPFPHCIKIELLILVVDRLGHAKTGVLADIDFVEHIFRAFAREEQCPEDSSGKAKRN